MKKVTPVMGYGKEGRFHGANLSVAWCLAKAVLRKTGSTSDRQDRRS
jgi:hypothetical protein